MDTIRDAFAVIHRRFTSSANVPSLPELSRRNALVKRQLDDGPIAGIAVGVVVFCALLCFCLYPVVVGSLRRRQRRQQREQNAQHDAETGIASDALPVTLPDGSERRLSSTDSVKPIGSSSRSEPTHRDSKEDGQRNAPLEAGPESAWGSQTYTGSPESPAAPGAGNDLAHHVGDGNMTPFPIYDGAYYPGADPSEPRGANADYYSPSIPSEAFGMYTMSSPTDQSESSKMRMRGSSLRNSVKDLLRKASGRDRTMSSTTSGDAEGSGLADGTPLQTIFPTQNRTDSPTEMSPVTSSPPPLNLPQSARSLGGPARGLSEDDHQQSSPPAERSFKYSPPVHAGPGTVNPMDIMPASSEPERWHRTDHDLYMVAHGSPSTSVSPAAQSQPQFSPVVNPVSSPPAASPLTLPPHLEEPLRHDTDQTIKQEHMSDQPQDVEMSNVPSENYLHPDPDPGRHFSYPSDQSTPFHGLASTNPSSHNTPSTLHTDTPSPESSGVASDFRHSVSPAASNPSPRHGQGHFACTVPDCGQVFDQHHKLNHHARYHAKQHRCEYANCGKGFGTKTHLQRHINDRHLHSKKFHCAFHDCEYSRSGGKSFLRKDNWKRHMTRIHQVAQQDLPEPVEFEEMAVT